MIEMLEAIGSELILKCHKRKIEKSAHLSGDCSSLSYE